MLRALVFLLSTYICCLGQAQSVGEGDTPTFETGVIIEASFEKKLTVVASDNWPLATSMVPLGPLFQAVSPYYFVTVHGTEITTSPIDIYIPLPEGADAELLSVARLVVSSAAGSKRQRWERLEAETDGRPGFVTTFLDPLLAEETVIVLRQVKSNESETETQTLTPAGSVIFSSGITVGNHLAGLGEAVEISAEVSEQWPLSRTEPGKPFTFVSPYYTVSSSREVRGGFTVGLPVPEGLDPSSLSVYFFSPGEQSSSDFYDDLWLSPQSRYDAETNTLVISESAFFPDGSVFVLAKPGVVT